MKPQEPELLQKEVFLKMLQISYDVIIIIIIITKIIIIIIILKSAFFEERLGTIIYEQKSARLHYLNVITKILVTVYCLSSIALKLMNLGVMIY